MSVKVSDRGWMWLAALWLGLSLAGLWDKSWEVVFLRFNLAITSALLAFSRMDV